MPKAQTNTKPSADDFLFSMRVKMPTKCHRCGTRKQSDTLMWFENRERHLYCEECKVYRLTEAGQAEAVIAKLLSSGPQPGPYAASTRKQKRKL